MDVGFKTDRGIRRSNNEDACFVMIKDRVFIIADGVGGNNSGEIASRTAVNEVAKYVEDHLLLEFEDEEEVLAYFDDCIKAVNFKVIEQSQKYEQNKGMATTLVIGYLFKNHIYIFNIGDSRAYLFRAGNLTQITTDHSYVNTLLKAGIISEEEALTHENKNMITRAVGADYTVDADDYIIEYNLNDIFLLCTDGLHGEVSPEEIIEILNQNKSMGEISDMLIDKANVNGGNDNITIICLKIMEEDIYE